MKRTNGSGVRIASRNGLVACVWLLAISLLWMATSPARADGVHVALVPDTVAAAAGDTVYLELDVTEAGAPFNAFDAVIGFEPSALTFLPTSPLTLQEGSLMTGACATSPFQYFVAAADSLLISIAIQCAGVSLTGPGQLYKLRFRAQDVQQGTWVHIRHIQFYDAGIYVNPAYATDAYVVIGAPTGVAAPAVPAGLSLGAAPNPCRSGTVFSVGSDNGGEQSLSVYDITGRMVRSLERGSFAPGARRVAWDARDNAGGRVSPGVYQVVFRAPGCQRCIRVAVIP